MNLSEVSNELEREHFRLVQRIQCLIESLVGPTPEAPGQAGHVTAGTFARIETIGRLTIEAHSKFDILENLLLDSPKTMGGPPMAMQAQRVSR